MTRARSLAAAQTIPRRGDVAANVADHLRLIHVAAQEQVRLLVFPELSLTGYELCLAQELAFSERDPRLAPLLERSAATRITLVVGAPVRLEDRLHIGAFLLGPDRSVQLYTKQHLGAFPPAANPGGPVPPAEATVFQPGHRNPLLRWESDTAAVAVCADTSRPSHPREAARRGARTYLASMFVIPADLDAEMARLGEYARRHSMAVVCANFGGPSGGLPAAGCSAVLSETGELLARLPARGSGLALAAERDGGWRAKAVVLEDGTTPDRA